LRCRPISLAHCYLGGCHDVSEALDRMRIVYVDALGMLHARASISVRSCSPPQQVLTALPCAQAFAQRNTCSTHINTCSDV
jgi:hypothetical protein